MTTTADVITSNIRDIAETAYAIFSDDDDYQGDLESSCEYAMYCGIETHCNGIDNRTVREKRAQHRQLKTELGTFLFTPRKEAP